MGINLQALGDKPLPILVVAGDRGRAALAAHEDAENIAGATDLTLANYFSPSWADAIADRRGEIGSAMKEFIRRNAGLVAPTEFSAERAEGEITEITYSIRGKGEPLILMPLALAPSQWQPLIDDLSQHFCTITLGGKHLGSRHLEIRAQSSYMRHRSTPRRLPGARHAIGGWLRTGGDRAPHRRPHPRRESDRRC
jgi:hypothetical protein